MKKKILFITLLLPFCVFAVECPVVNNTSTLNNRSITCSINNVTTTSFETSNSVTVLDNSVCTIKCTEKLLLSIEPLKKVLSGMSFSYPLYVSGERKCTATYKFNGSVSSYESNIKTLVNEYNNLSGTAKNNKRLEIENLYNDKLNCDNFTNYNNSEYEKYKYKFNGDVSLEIEKSDSTDRLQYTYRELSEYESNVNGNVINYDACNLNINSVSCTGGSTTIQSWTEVARLFGKYTMNNSYVEDYTGKVSNIPSSNSCDASDRYFVDFDEVTNLGNSIDANDNGYNLVLTANNLGNNLSNTGDKWNLNVNCWYQVKNLFLSNKKTITNPGTATSENNSLAFSYRVIDLDNPFPKDVVPLNWIGKENIISENKDRLNSLSRFVITLNRSSIEKVREYNDNVNTYESFNITKDANGVDRSDFIENHANRIVERK